MEEANKVAPVPTNVSKALVHHFAEQVASKLSFEPGDPIEPLVVRLGGRIEYKNPVGFEDNRLPESIIVRAQSNFTIFVPSITSQARDRFTIAHELGHLFLHYPMLAKSQPGITMVATRWVDNADPVQQRAEWEANWFAAAFLMPTEVFREAFIELRDIGAVAKRFAVSPSAAEIRAKSLSLS